MIEEIPKLHNCFEDIMGFSIIYTSPVFVKWKESLKYEIIKLKKDTTTTELIELLDSFNGYSDKRMLDEITLKCEIIRDYFVDYTNTDECVKAVAMNKKKNFIVHGHDTETRDQVELFLRRLNLSPIVLANEASKGLTVIEKFEANSDVSFAIILYTACDEGRVKGSTTLQDRARQNVIFEHGYFCAKLGRGNVVALHEPGVEIPSDLSGVLYISLDDDWKAELKKEMCAAGLEADWIKG